MKKFGLVWNGQKKTAVFVGRFTSKSNREPDAIWSWIRKVKEADAGLSDFMDLISFSGMRLVEAVNCYNLIGSTAKKEGLQLLLSPDGKERVSGYYDFERECLEHFWFGELFLRETKNVFLSFAPKDLVTRISESKPVPSSANITKFCRRRLGESQLKMIRKAQGTFMLNYLKKEEVDLLQGRVTGDIFMTNYFTPSVLTGLKSRVFQGIADIQGKIRL
jgi:intergrase/recombinase